jgi:hypothetical protein
MNGIETDCWLISTVKHLTDTFFRLDLLAIVIVSIDFIFNSYSCVSLKFDVYTHACLCMCRSTIASYRQMSISRHFYRDRCNWSVRFTLVLFSLMCTWDFIVYLQAIVSMKMSYGHSFFCHCCCCVACDKSIFHVHIQLNDENIGNKRSRIILIGCWVTVSRKKNNGTLYDLYVIRCYFRSSTEWTHRWEKQCSTVGYLVSRMHLREWVSEWVASIGDGIENRGWGGGLDNIKWQTIVTLVFKRCS